MILGNGGMRLARYGRDGTPGAEIPVLPVAEVSRRLGKSRRQVYRYVVEGRLTPCVKILDQWLFEEGEVARVHGGRGLPRWFQPLFPDYALSRLDPEGDAALILERAMDQGTRRHLRWIRGRYGDARLRRFLRSRGWRLSPRSRAFWRAVLGVQAAPMPAWRRVGARLGGIA